MPNNKQQSKRLKTDEIKRQRNKATKTVMRSSIRNVVEAETKEEAQTKAPEAVKRIDKAAQKNIIHSNTAARMKSRLARTVAAK
ncbi:MAG: small subunit ribosomal protein S20 [Planctomycetota bacterium]|jgi:small subunit ribosomal protein S20